MYKKTQSHFKVSPKQVVRVVYQVVQPLPSIIHVCLTFERVARRGLQNGARAGFSNSGKRRLPLLLHNERLSSDPDGYRGFAESSVRGNGDDEDDFERLIRESNQKVHKPQRKAQESNKKRTKFLRGMHMSEAVFSFTNNARIPEDIPYRQLGRRNPF